MPTTEQLNDHITFEYLERLKDARALALALHGDDYDNKKNLGLLLAVIQQELGKAASAALGNADGDDYTEMQLLTQDALVETGAAVLAAYILAERMLIDGIQDQGGRNDGDSSST